MAGFSMHDNDDLPTAATSEATMRPDVAAAGRFVRAHAIDTADEMDLRGYLFGEVR